jgi:hypothetical protein
MHVCQVSTCSMLDADAFVDARTVRLATLIRICLVRAAQGLPGYSPREYHRMSPNITLSQPPPTGLCAVVDGSIQPAAATAVVLHAASKKLRADG